MSRQTPKYSLVLLAAVALAIISIYVAPGRWFTRLPPDADSIVTAMYEGKSSDRIIEAIEANGDPSAFGSWNRSSLLNAAVRSGRSDLVEWLLTKGANPNPQGEHPLYSALRADDVKLARQLLQAGASWSALQNDGITIERWAEEERPGLLRTLKGGVEGKGQ